MERIRTARLRQLYASLLDEHGPQEWWPAKTVEEVLIGAVLVQHTRWQNVERAIKNLKRHHALNTAVLADKSMTEIAGLIRSAGTYEVKAKRLQALSAWYENGGRYARLSKCDPANLRAALLAVHGIGPETADTILLYAFQQPVFVADAYARRLLSRYDEIDTVPNYAVLKAWVESTLREQHRFYNEFHALIVRHCKLRCRTHPVCSQCHLRTDCRHGNRVFQPE